MSGWRVCPRFEERVEAMKYKVTAPTADPVFPPTQKVATASTASTSLCSALDHLIESIDDPEELETILHLLDQLKCIP